MKQPRDKDGKGCDRRKQVMAEVKRKSGRERKRTPEQPARSPKSLYSHNLPQTTFHLV